MSDVGHDHQSAEQVSVTDVATPVVSDAATPLRASPSTGGSGALLRRRAMQSQGPCGAAGSSGRAQRSVATLRPITESARSTGARIQRTPASLAATLPSTSTSAAARIRPMAPGLTIRRDFSDMVTSVGNGFAAAGRGLAAARRGLARGAVAAGKMAVDGATAVKDGALAVARAVHRSDFNDLNATQYLVSAGGKIEAIDRRVEDGVVVYYKTGLVTRGDGDRPTVEAYDEAIAMPEGWLPTVTHINGMMVKPNSGIGSAIKLQQELENAGGEALLASEVPSVLYTYSAHRGFVTDLAECVWGKLYQDDDATDRQTQIMIDAVKNQHRTTVSAHSRGTIKTDNAVRNAHARLSGEYLPIAQADPAVIQRAADAAHLAVELNTGTGVHLSEAMLRPVYQRLFAREEADRLATADMDRYIQLIYAGNAVQFPSASVNLNLIVAGSDPVTIGVGKYFAFAVGAKTKMTDVAGGHGFDENYAATVAQLIIADLQAQQP